MGAGKLCAVISEETSTTSRSEQQKLVENHLSAMITSLQRAIQGRALSTQTPRHDVTTVLLLETCEAVHKVVKFLIEILF